MRSTVQVEPKQAVEVEVSTAPWQDVFAGVARVAAPKAVRAGVCPMNPNRRRPDSDSRTRAPHQPHGINGSP